MKKLLFLLLPIFILSLASCKSNEPQKVIDDAGFVAYKKEIPFENRSRIYNLEKHSTLDTYFFNSTIPYVSIDDYVNSIAFYNAELEVTSDFDYIFLKEGYNKHIQLNYDNNDIYMYDFGIYTVDEIDYNKRNVYPYLSYKFNEADEDILRIIDLDKYNLKIEKFDDNLYLPFHVLDAIFSSESYYYIYYLSSKYVAFSLNDGYITCDDIKKDNKIKMSPEYLEYNYNVLSFIFNELYGLNYTDDANALSILEEYKEEMLDETKYFSATKKFISRLEDCHTKFHGYNDLFSFDLSNYQSERQKNLNSAYFTYTNKFYSKFNKYNDGLTALDETTAFVSFGSFEIDSKNGTAAKIKGCLEECISLGITNVILDVTTNGGGDTFALAEVLGLLTNNRIFMNTYNAKNGHLVSQEIRVDSDNDGDFYDPDAYTDFNYYVLASDFSYSCANTFTSYCKDHNLAKVIGVKTGGGGCCVAPVVTPTGAFITYSGLTTAFDKNMNSIEYGVEPDYELDKDYIYNKVAILNAISALK